MVSVDKYGILGLSAIIIFGFAFFYHLFVEFLPDAFNLCYLTLLFLGLGLLTEDRLLFGIGAFFVIFPLITVIFLIFGAFTYFPRAFDFWLIHGIITHTYTVILTIIGCRKKFRYFHRSTWWVSTILMVSIWFLTFFINDSTLNVNYTLGPPFYLQFLGLWGFVVVTLISTTALWFFINYRYSEPNQSS